jgi:O-antigen/teichoic acid export membrane protein
MFRETLRYNYNFQVISFFSLLNDPITKMLLTKFGGTEYTGLYELASKLVLQVRNVLATANQALVPIFSSLQETDPGKIGAYFKSSFFYVFIISTFAFSSFIAFAPLFSIWWLGGVNTVFVLLIGVVAVSWYINSLTMPAYFANLGSGNMKWNTRSHVGMGMSNLVLSLLLGILFNPLFICVGWLFSLAFFSILILVFYLRDNKLRLHYIMPASNWIYLGTAMATTLVVTVSFLTASSFKLWLFSAVSVVYLSIHTYFLFRNLVGRGPSLQLSTLLSWR